MRGARAMERVILQADEDVIRKARQYATEHGAALEALLAEYLAVLADRAGRRLTLREQTYVDHRPSEEVVDALRAEAAANSQKMR
jgi:hypothetical protein